MSPNFRETLIAKQKMLGQKESSLAQDVETRWNSTSFMITSILKNKDALSLVSSSINCVLPNFTLLEELIKVYIFER
jgi:hypothetical protein